MILLFFTPRIPTLVKNKIKTDKEFSFDLNKGFPLQYFRGETLSSHEVNYRIRFIFFNMLMAFCGLSPMLGNPANSIALPIPKMLNQSAIERSFHKGFSINNLLKIANFYDENSNKITLSKSQIENLDRVLEQYRSGNLSAKEAVLQLRGGNGWLDVIAIGVFVVVVNLFFPEKAEGFQHLLPPHINLRAWIAPKPYLDGGGVRQSLPG